MDNVIKPWVGLWDYLDGNFWSIWTWAYQDLTSNEVAWQPIPEVASVGWNLHHLGEMLDYYLAYFFGRGTPVQKTPLLTMRAGSRDDGRHRDLRPIAAYHKQVRSAYREFLVGLTAADLDRKPGPERKHAMNYAWAIGHIAEHESYHLGKCTLLRSLLRKSAVRSP
jgi:hypothetical protein